MSELSNELPSNDIRKPIAQSPLMEVDVEFHYFDIFSFKTTIKGDNWRDIMYQADKIVSQMDQWADENRYYSIEERRRRVRVLLFGMGFGVAVGVYLFGLFHYALKLIP